MFFGTVYITLKPQNSKSFQRNICTDYRRKTGASIVYISYFVEAESHAVTLHRHTIRGADLFDVSLHDDVAELLVQLHGIADAIRLLTGNQCVLPEPPKGSRTTALLMEEFMIGYAKSAIGFMVG